MRHGSSNRRRGRGNGGGGNRRGNNQRMQVFDSNGPDVRIRGTAHQVAEKYIALSKDASSAGDTILAESYMQHAEHYTRIISAWDVQEEQNKSQGSSEPRSRGGSKGKNKEEDDLSLPSSILGESPKVSSAERTAEAAAS